VTPHPACARVHVCIVRGRRQRRVIARSLRFEPKDEAAISGPRNHPVLEWRARTHGVTRTAALMVWIEPYGSGASDRVIAWIRTHQPHIEILDPLRLTEP